MKRIFLIGLLVSLTICISGQAFAACEDQMALWAAYKAKRLCSEVFVARQSPASVLDNELDMLKSFRTTIDYADKSVTVSVGKKTVKRAIYREGLGCTIVHFSAIEEVRGQTMPYVAPLPRDPEKTAWPTGDSVLKADPLPEVDQTKLDQALDKAFSEPDPKKHRRTRAVVVVYKGRIVAERYAPGFTRDMPLLGWSMTKSVTNALVGILVGQSRLALMDPAPVPEWVRPNDPRGAITLDQLLRMSSGLKFDEAYTKNSDATCMLFGTYDMAAYTASLPLEAEPDSKWYYSSGTTNIVSRVIRHSLGSDQDAYLSFPRRFLFNRIGMRSAVMEPDASGTFVGSSFMYATARDWARFGLLYLQDGVWEGERILPESWVKYSRTPTPKAPQGKYGAYWWLNAGPPGEESKRPMPRLPVDLFMASGFEGQTVAVLPSRKMVVVRLGLSQQGAWDIESFLAEVLEAIPGKK